MYKTVFHFQTSTMYLNVKQDDEFVVIHVCSFLSAYEPAIRQKYLSDVDNWYSETVSMLNDLINSVESVGVPSPEAHKNLSFLYQLMEKLDMQMYDFGMDFEDL